MMPITPGTAMSTANSPRPCGPSARVAMMLAPKLKTEAPTLAPTVWTTVPSRSPGRARARRLRAARQDWAGRARADVNNDRPPVSASYRHLACCN